ncbi:hypothetical protein KIL84_011112 [Mauremys mutica]|uniref:Uncharacterized protein n=1 Tax=Mauremys mutica TaxID=74926 RepID=A0A9D3XE84_9SAUR|nr:hypothetical protein KIL84_011112 [Mauremys mutica]
MGAACGQEASVALHTIRGSSLRRCGVRGAKRSEYTTGRKNNDSNHTEKGNRSCTGHRISMELTKETEMVARNFFFIVCLFIRQTHSKNGQSCCVCRRSWQEREHKKTIPLIQMNRECVLD